MRWTDKQYPKTGDKRTIKKFLFLPLCLDNEYRWLETTYIVQTYHISLDHSTGTVRGKWLYSKWGTYTEKELEDLEKEDTEIE